MPIKVYNTRSKAKETFEPLNEDSVGMYLCGPTVYKPSHIGHMVGPVIFDVIKRYLVYSGYNVNFVVNITDVDDKLIAESTARNLTMKEVAEEMTADYMNNLAAMGVDTIDHFPKATEHMGNIIKVIKKLEEKDYAYASDGDVYFDVAKCKDYGSLSGRSIEAMQGEGGGTANRKRNTADFALWKSAKEGEPSWGSPWGKGRPGWHIECSAMSQALLGDTFDIHGGGLDLMFPHHENEIAQSECCNDAVFAKYWMHNGLMQAADEVGKLGGRNTKAAEEEMTGDQTSQEDGKMGKSKGANAFRDLLEEIPAETIRFFLLSTHYRRPIYYSKDKIAEVATSMESFYRFFTRYERVTGDSFYNLPRATTRTAGDAAIAAASGDLMEAVKKHRDNILEFMDDDFNTGGSIGELFELLKAINKFVDGENLESKPTDENVTAFKAASSVARELTSLMGLFIVPQEAAGSGDDALAGGLMDLVIELRAELRKEKNWTLADKIRDSLNALNIELEDRPTGTEWSVKK